MYAHPTTTEAKAKLTSTYFLLEERVVYVEISYKLPPMLLQFGPVPSVDTSDVCHFVDWGVRRLSP